MKKRILLFLGAFLFCATSLFAATREDSAQILRTMASSPAAAGILIAIVIIGLVLYIYSCLCLQLIAQKTGTEPAWLAWIPIANIFLMCKVAGLSYWWILTLLAGIIPFLGSLIILGFSGYLWFKIAEARNKEGWIGVLCVLPLVNLAVMGYLAFTD